MKKILLSAKSIEKEIIAHRRHIHENPEVGFCLKETASYVKAALAEMGIEAHSCGHSIPQEIQEKFNAAGFPNTESATGLTATIGQGSPCILLRADMDALPLEETTGLPFASTNGCGHMCGHDCHTAMLLGAAKILKQREAELCGTVKLMFQTGEECGCGAKFMVDDGLLENPKVDAALAIHLMSDVKSGTVHYVKGVASAAMDSFMVKIQGKGTHSSQPQNGIDPLTIANQIYTAANLMIGRETDPKETVAFGVGKMGGGTVVNIIPDTAEIQMAVRTFNRDVRQHVITRLPELIDGTVKMWRGTYDMRVFSTPSTYNDASLCEQLLPFIGEICGNDCICESAPMSGSEDFGYVSEQVPGMFLILGAGEPGAFPMHNPNMVLDEGVFVQGSAILANCAIEWLRSDSSKK